MAKLSKRQSLAYRMELTAWFGIVIFLLGLLGQAIVFAASVTNFARLPIVMHEQTSSFIASMVLSLLASILPPLVAFSVGERLAKPRAKYEHLYNGVLFAFLAIWLSSVFGAIFYPVLYAPATVPAVFEYLQYIPQFCALVIVVALAYVYGKKFKRTALHDFTPYQFLLIGSVALLLITGIVSFISTAQGQAIELLAMAITGLLIGVGMVAIPYIFSTEKHSLTRLTHAFVAGSIGIWALATLATLTMFVPNFESLHSIVASVTGLAAWVVYVYLLHRHAA